MNTSTENSQSALLEGTKGQTVLLQNVEIEAQLDDLLLTVKARQHYKNTTKKNIETIYTFPLAWGTTLLGLTASLAGKSWQGIVMPKNAAEETYEKAIKDGDTPIMVEKSADGLYTAHMGNLKPGEEAVIEIEYAQLLKCEQGQVRLAIPTTVAPRYGDPVETGKLNQPASVETSLEAAYPLALELHISGALGLRAVRCPSHHVTMQVKDDSTLIHLTQGGYLDRDFVLVINGVEDEAFFSLAQDGEEFVAMMSIVPSLSSEAAAIASDIALKILVDCSGSMQGESMALAKAGLTSLVPLLGPNDRVSYSLFGNEPHRIIDKLQAVTPLFKETLLLPAIAQTEANLGGTKMNEALHNTVAIHADNAERPVNILLITDGEVWDIENIIQLARQSNHRIFAIGVGSSPAESLLREIAEHSDGACELVSPNEDMEDAIQRMVKRMRQGVVAELAVDWHSPVVWHSPVPKVIYPGETIHLSALLANKPTSVPILTAAHKYLSLATIPTPTTLASNLSLNESPAFSRIIGEKRLRAAASSEEATQLAIRYQLVTEHTNLIMVVYRAAEDKASGLPEPHQIDHMVAEGWHGLHRSTGSGSAMQMVSMHSFMRNQTAVEYSCSYELETPRYMRRQDDTELPGITPLQILSLIEEIALTHNKLADGMTRLLNCGLPTAIDNLISEVGDELGDRVIAWAIFFDWLINTMDVGEGASRHVNRLIQHTLQGTTEEAEKAVHIRLSDSLPYIEDHAWGTLSYNQGIIEHAQMALKPIY